MSGTLWAGCSLAYPIGVAIAPRGVKPWLSGRALVQADHFQRLGAVAGWLRKHAEVMV